MFFLHFYKKNRTFAAFYDDCLVNMLKTIIIVIGLLAMAIVLMCVRILLRKDGTFSSQDVGQSKAMRQRGIGCTRSQDRQRFAKNARKMNINEL